MTLRTSTMSVESSRKMTPPAPRKEPAARRLSKSIFMPRASSAVSTGVEVPPGMTALSGLPPFMPPAAASRSMRGAPMGNS